MSRRPQSSVTDFLGIFAAEATASFPALEGRLLILNATEENIGIVGGLDPAKTGLTEETLPGYLNATLPTVPSLNGFEQAITHYDPAHDLYLVIVTTQTAYQDAMPRDVERKLIHSLDHELGHIVAPGGMSWRAPDSGETEIIRIGNRAECVADAFALLRHYQRFGLQSAFRDATQDVANRATTLLTGDTDHFTAFVEDSVIRHRTEHNVKNLTPAETAALASKLAIDYTVSPQTIMALRDTFADLREPVKKGDWNAVFHGILKKTFDPATDNDTFRFGALWLREMFKTHPELFKVAPDVEKKIFDALKREEKIRELAKTPARKPAKPASPSVSL